MKPSSLPLVATCLLFLHGGAAAVDANTDGVATLRFDQGQATVIRNGAVLASALITTDAPVRNHPGVGNSAFLIVADCFVVVREVHDLTPTCHTPPASLVELTRLDGDDRSVTRFRWPASFFQGTSLSSPAGDWGLILSGNRAMIDGFLVVRSDGSHATTVLDPPLDWSLSYGRVRFEGDTAIFPSLKRGNAIVSLLIHGTGASEVVGTTSGALSPTARP